MPHLTRPDQKHGLPDVKDFTAPNKETEDPEVTGCTMSSGCDSVGDLIPPDMLQVFTEDQQGGRGKRGRRRIGSFSRAFKWLKRQRRKNRRAAEIRGDLLATGSPVELPQSTLKTGPKEEAVGAVSLQKFQENVFVEGDRPKYVLDLHTEAQQGLKLQQQEDDKNGIDYPDDQSMISTVSAQTEVSMAFSELRGFESESTATDSVSMCSSMSSRSTRSGLKRQASTFRPLKPDKSAEKTKSRRKHLRTVVGIPRHIQRELGLDRAAWITTSPLDAQLSNGDLIIPAIFTTVDGASTSIRDYLQGQDNLHTVKKHNTEVPTLAKPKDDIPQRSVNHSEDPENSGANTLVVPWTENSTGAVMSISPQATYMSKIIPNAVLPPSVDVVELSRSRSRSSVRTVSKSSLVSASPASTRPSSRVSSNYSSTRSNYSQWSSSGSSETLVSDSSTISSSSTPRVASRASQIENTARPVKLNNQGSHVPIRTTHVNGDSTEEDDNRKTGSAGDFTRNLSVVKRSKIPPAPPNRSHSLHVKQTRKGSENPYHLANVSTPDGSPYPTVISGSEMVTTHELSPKRGLYPSKGLITVPSKEIQSASSIKIYRNNLQISSVGAPHSYTNGTSKLAELKNTLLSASLSNCKNSSLRSLFDVPNHPKVLAPSPPPPEAWAHNHHTFELLCGPGPVNYACWAKKRGLKIVDEPDMTSSNGEAASLLQAVKLNGKVESLAPAASVTLPPSPPPEHCPPIPNISQAKPLPPPPDFVPSSPTLAAKAIKDLTTWIPPPPLFPPPAPPVGTASATPVAVPNDTDFPPPPPPFSPRSVLTMPQLPPDVPPPPSQEPPPSPIPPSEPQKIPPPPQESQSLAHNVLVTSSVTSKQINVPPPPLPTDVRSQQVSVPPPPPLPTDVRSQQVSVPPPPPLPTDVRSQQVSVPPPPPLPTDVRSQQVSVPPLPTDVRSQQVSVPPPPPLPTDVRSQQASVPLPPLPSDVKMEDRLETIETAKRTSSPSPTKEETSIPVVTQSLLQMVRLRSVKSNQSQAVDLAQPSQPKQKSGVNQEVPPKPIRQSLIMTSLPPDVEALSGTEPKNESPSINSRMNTTTVSNTQKGSTELKTKSNNIVQKTENTRLEPVCSSSTSPTAEPSNTSPPTELPTKQPCSETETFKVQVTAPVPATLPNTMGLNNQSISAPQTQAQELNKLPQNAEKQSSTVEMPSQLEGEQPKPQTPMPTVSSTRPVVSSPANSSVRLQEAIRLKAATMSTKDNQAKHSGLRSPLPLRAGGTTVPNSPASMASFIFSKSPKKIVIETPSSLEVQADLRKTLVAEFASFSDSANSNVSHKTANKVPPPISKKPNAKVESVVQNSAESVSKTEHVQTETVQTAGQEVQTENSEKTSN